MDDFEYSVHISDQDWQCFYSECEACNLLPPSLAGLDDSGMSDIDDTAFTRPNRTLTVDPQAGPRKPDCPVDGPPDSEGSPVDSCLSKYGFDEMDNVLSGSEEDIHLQSVNTFFERLRSLSEPEKCIETSQVGAAENGQGVPAVEHCRDGQEASNRNGALPETTPKFKSVAASSDTAIGKEVAGPVATISNTNTIKKDGPESEAGPRLIASNSQLKTYKSAHPEPEPVGRQEACNQSAVNEGRRALVPHESNGAHVWPGVRSRSDKWIASDRHLDDVEQGDLSMNQSINPKDIGEEDRELCFQQFDTEPKNIFDKSSQLSSLSPSTKKKRRRKKRMSLDLSEGDFVYKKHSSSEDEYTQVRKTEPCWCEGDISPQIGQTEKDEPTNSGKKSSTLKILAKDDKSSDGPHHHPQSDSPESTDRQRMCKEAVPAAVDRSVTTSHQTGQCIASDSFSNVVTNVPAYAMSHLEESIRQYVTPSLPVLCGESASGPSVLATEMTVCEGQGVHSWLPQQYDSIIDSVTHKEAVPEQKGQREVCAAKSPLAAGDGNSGRDETRLWHGEVDHSHQLEARQHEETSPPLFATVTMASELAEQPSSNSNIQLSQRRASDPLSAADCAKPPDTHDSSTATTTAQSAGTIYTLTSNRKGETELFPSLSSEGVIDVARPSPVDRHLEGQEEVVEQHEEQDIVTGFTSVTALHDTDELDCAITCGAEAHDLEQIGNAPQSVFTMSAFWSDMEKLTIKDILGLRMMENADSPRCLSPILEISDMYAETDSGFFHQLSEAKLEECSRSTEPSFAESPSGTPPTGDPATSRDVTWGNELPLVTSGTDVFPKHVIMSPFSDIPGPAGGPQNVRKIPKSVSVHNLHAMESAPSGSTPTGWDAESDAVYSSDGYVPRTDSGVDASPSSSFTGNASASGESFRISLGDIFEYFFGRKESTPRHLGAENYSSYCVYGNSVPENYDHFFSEFDSESLFSTPLSNNEPVPLYSSPRSSHKSLQFPEAYDYFFASSSSDSSSESDEEDCGPIRVVTRFSHEAKMSQIPSNAYQNFITDRDLRQNLSWNTFSFRNILSKRLSQRENSTTLALEPVHRSHPRLSPTSPEPFQEPFVIHLEERISQQLAQQSFFRNQDLLTLSNPRLDSPLLPLKQSDMCLVCIAFASWVLKTANPQVGDAWKAVLLANVSALSAIRYLRKHKMLKSEASGEEPHHASPDL